jgi:hypothetical protein
MFDNFAEIEDELIEAVGFRPSGTGSGFGWRDIDWHLDDDDWSNPILARKLYAVFKRHGLVEGTEFNIYWHHELDLPTSDAEFLQFDGGRYLIVDILPDEPGRDPRIGVFIDAASDPDNLLFALSWAESRALAAKIIHVTDIAEFG